MAQLAWFVGGVVVAVACLAVTAVVHRLRHRRITSRDLLLKHFGGHAANDIEVQSREFSNRVCVDAYRAVTQWIETNCQVNRLVGIPSAGGFMSAVGIAHLVADSTEPHFPSALEYDNVDIGEGQPSICIKHALWLLTYQNTPLAILWRSTTTHSGCGFQTKLQIDCARSKSGADGPLVQQLFEHIEAAVQQALAYRGKILSLESATDYRGMSGGIKVHRLQQIRRDDVILPETTVRLLERNVIRFVEQRPELAKAGMPSKKGLLLYGPPGTGKTHTIHYLINSLPKHTTLLVTAEQVALLDEYMTLARLLQPSIVVLEDVDLVGRDREQLDGGRESLLNRLLNEMDGLRQDAEILFFLTTNRPDALEKALAARPGRIDQAIEFPLPDEAGRRKLLRLYAARAAIADDVVEHATRITEGVSASFIKELMRRAIQFHLECRVGNGDLRILQNDIDQAIDELLFVGGSLNRALLGASESGADD